MALNLDSYGKTQWEPKMPITQGRMDNLEDGVYVNREAIKSLDSSTDSNTTNIGNIQSDIGTNTVSLYSGKTLWDAIATLYNTISAATSDSSAGASAWSQIVGLIGLDTLGNLKQSLSDYMAAYTNEDIDIRRTLGTIISQNGQSSYAYSSTNGETVYDAIKKLNDALGYDESGKPVFGTKDSEENVITVLNVMNQLSSNVETVLTALSEAAPSPTYTSLANRLSIMNQAITNATDALSLAKTSSVYLTEVDGVQSPTTYGSLDERLEHIEGEIVNSTANLSSAINQKISISNITNDLNTLDSTEGHVLDARQGRVIKELLYKTTDTAFTTTDTVASRIKGVNDRVNTINTQLGTNNYGEGNTITDDIDSRVKKSDIYNDLDYVPAQDATDDKVLDARQGKALKELIDGLDNSTDARLDTIETELNDARIEIGTDEESGDPIMSTLDQRLDAMDTIAAGIRADLTTVISELGMTDANGLKTMGTRIDDLADNVAALATELDMQMSEDKIVDTNSRIDSIETVIDHVQGENDEVPNGLKQRISALESDLDTAENNITGLDQRLDMVDGGNALTGNTLVSRVGTNESAVSNLTERITTLENNPASTTEVKSVSDFEALAANEANSTKDYIVGPDDDGFYKYYRIIETSTNTYEKVLISGGNSGSGNSFGQFAASINEIVNPNVNTDYFVGDDTNGYLHYRYILNTNSNELYPVIIGVHDYYQIDTEETVDDGDTVTYLNLYKFDTARNQETITDADDINIIGRVKLPKGGDGTASVERIYVKIPAGQNQYISYKDLQDNGLSLGFSYTCYSVLNGEYEYVPAQYRLSLEDGTIIKSSNGVVPTITRESYNNGIINISFNKSDNLAQYCSKNESTKFILTLSVPDNEAIIPRSLTVMITPIELSLDSSFSDQQTYSNKDDLVIPYEFVGITGENISFEIMLGDNSTQQNITASSVINTAASRITIRKSVLANKTGIYNLHIRAGQVVSGVMLYSNTLTYQLGLIDASYANVLLFSGASLEEQTVEQYRTLTLPYYLYLPAEMDTALVSYDVKQIIYDDSNVIVREDTVPALIRPSDTLSAGPHSYALRISTMLAETEYYKLTVTCEDVSLIFNIKVNMSAEQINIETQGLVFDFKPEQFSNNASTLEERLWKYENDGIQYSMRIPENAHFDWRTGGWIEDENHVPCFCIKAGSRVELIQQNIGQSNISPLTLFWNGMETTGSNFKCVFKIDNVKTPDAPFLTSLDTVNNTVINYGKLILSEKQNIEDDSTLLHSYLNTRYLYTKTINSSNKVVKESIGTTVLNDGINEVYGQFGSQLTEAKRAAAETKAAKKNSDKIKDYINNIYTIANYASVLEHKEALLNILAGNTIGTTIDYSTIKDTILTYLQNVNNATNVYNTLLSLENDTTSIIYAYRQIEPENLDAILNGFVVEGKEGKDGIIAMLTFTFETTIKNGGTFTSQTVSVSPISTNSFSNTATFLVTVEDKKYEVTMADDDGTYTNIISIQDASNETQTAYGLELNALGSNIYLPSGRVSYAHSEGDTIEFEYNINAPLERKINSSIIIYEDGVPSAAKLYATGNNILEQTSPGAVIIGSDDCDVYIYKMRLYNHALSDKQILGNFYADGLTVDDMIDRYNRNKNLITNNIDELTPQLVAQECPDLRVIMIEAPNLTSGKTSFIKNSKIRCIYKNGRPEDNWVALNAYHAGQGTSSDNYGASARNLDIIFGFDGKDTVIVPKPQKNNYQFDPNYKSILIKGLDTDTTNDIKTAEEYEAEGYSVHYNTGENEPGMVSLSSTSVPNNWFNIKVNVASSENTNNAFLQKRFDRYLQQHVYQTPAQKRDSNIKNDMEFFNCVIFIKETGTPKEFTKDTGEERSWHFYGIGNIGDSKKTDKTRVNVPNDPYEFAVEISDNGLLLSGFYSGLFYISEASKIRSQTPREQTNGNMDLPEAISMIDSHVCTTEEYTINNGNYNFSIAFPSSTTMYFVPENSAAYYRRFIYLNNTWTEVGEPVSFKRTSYGIKYPISKAEWECSLNEYNSALYNFGGKGWDKSFEFRYDITTKDGETVARSDLEEALNNLHQSTNKKAFADMYSYIVTSPNNTFVDQLNNWFIDNSLSYWYLFTERYTMIDSRAKNTFYHYGKIYITEDEASGAKVTELTNIKNSHLEEYIENNHIQAYKTATAQQIANAELEYQIATATFLHENAQYFEVNNDKAAINNGYRFEMWGYDMDTALGINNNGQMVFSAGVEDIDKDASGWIYNEAESVIWRRVRENMYNQLAALYINLKGDCFNAENLIEEFDRLQAQFPEELWRADFERKYYRPFRDLNETTYLNDMANGRKKYQRRQFERNMAIYINSKYQRNGSYLENDLISFRPQFTWTAGRDTRIIIKPYSTMYINFALGNYDNTDDSTSTTAQSIFKRVERGEEFIINTSDYIHDYNNIQCILYNASRIMYLDGLGNFECKQFILGAAKKLSVLKLGSPVYENHSMTDITNLGLSTGLPLLEELDLTNIEFGTVANGNWISNPPQTFALENFPLLKRLDATGCNIRSFTFKDGGMLEHIIFPSGLTSIQFKNLYNLIDTYDENSQLIPAVVLTGAANLISYYSTNSYASSYTIVQNMINNSQDRITQLYLDDINWTINNMIDLEPLINLQHRLGSNMLLKGTITVTGNWSVVKKENYDKVFGINNITWILNEANKQIEYKLSFYKSLEDLEDEQEYYSSYVSQTPGYINIILGDDPVSAGNCPTPTKEQSVSKTYYFGTNKNTYYPWTGWRIYGDSQLPYEDYEVTDNLKLIAIFNEEPRLYSLKWYLHQGDSEPIHTVERLEYGSNYEQLAPTILDLKKQNKATYSFNGSSSTCNYGIFKGWQKQPIHLDETFFDEERDSFCIYGDWDEGENVSIETLKTQPSTTIEALAQKLLVLTNVNNASSTMPVGNTIDIEMGHDYKDGTVIIGKDATVNFGTGSIQTIYDDTNILRYNCYYNNNNMLTISPSVMAATAIKPFEDMTTRGFTLAIDYSVDKELITKVNSSSNGYYIICGCYSGIQGDSSSGFAIYYDYAAEAVKFVFGDLSRDPTFSSEGTQTCTIAKISNAYDRNIVVIRHQANSNKLYVYSGTNEAGLLNNIKSNTFERSIQHSLNAFSNPLYFGHYMQVSNQVQNTTTRPGVGARIYWAKYWNDDLGKDTCTHIASWPHETIRFTLEDYTNDNNPDSLNTTARNMLFSALQLSRYGGPQYEYYDYSVYHTSNQTGTQVCWGRELDYNKNSLYKTIANERFFQGLPNEIQSIIEKTPGKAVFAELYRTTNGQNYYYKISNVDTIDFAFIPSYIEVGGIDVEGVYSEEAYRPSNSKSASNCIVYNYANGFDYSNPTTSSDYMNLRFFGKPLKIGQKSNVIYDNYTETTPVYNAITQNGREIHSGDICICTTTIDNSSITNAYIYVTDEEINAGAPAIKADSDTLLYCSTGGWIQANSWWTRSVQAHRSSESVQTRATGQPFYYIQGHSGKPTEKTTPNNGNGAYFVYSFGV